MHSKAKNAPTSRPSERQSYHPPAGDAPAESEDTGPMRRLILSTVATAVLVVGTPAVLFAAPISQPHEQAAIRSADPHVQRVDYYWNHHHYAHRDWDRHHNR